MSHQKENEMNIRKLAMTMTCAIAMASWASPSLRAQQGPPTPQDTGQQGEFEGDHQDTGAAAIDGQEAPEVGNEAPEVGEPASATEPLNSLPDTDRVQDSQTDSIPNY
jgi:hypothetical protein